MAYHIIQNKNTHVNMLLKSGNQLMKANAQIIEIKSKGLFAYTVATADTTILIRDLANILLCNGIKIGEKRLFNCMRENGYLINKKRSDYNLPTQKSIIMNSIVVLMMLILKTIIVLARFMLLLSQR